MAIEAAYLPEEAVAPKDLGPELSRRARAVPVWAVLRTLGRRGVAELVDRCCAHASRLAEGLETIGFTVDNQVVLNQIVATIGSTDFTESVRGRVEAYGIAWFGPTHWAGRPALRFSVSSWATTAEDIDATLDAVAGALAALRAEPPIGFNHIALEVGDIDEALAFYGRLSTSTFAVGARLRPLSIWAISSSRCRRVAPSPLTTAVILD